MTAINMPKKDKEPNEEVPPRIGQSHRPLERYRLQVDRQIKNSFASLEAAEKAGKAIKKAHPVVQVSIYDSEQSQQILLQ